MQTKIEERNGKKNKTGKWASNIIDHKIALLSMAGAAASVGCDQCLDEIIPELRETGVTKQDIQRAVAEGKALEIQFEDGIDPLGSACERIGKDKGACSGNQEMVLGVKEQDKTPSQGERRVKQ